MGIPIGSRTTVTIQGCAGKAVTCEACNSDYVYIVERKGVGQGLSLLWLDNSGAGDRAESRAHKSLQLDLEKAFETVACPNCGWYQTAMVNAEKKYRLDTCLYFSLPIGLILLFVGFYLAGANSKFAIPVFVLTGLCFVGGPILGFVLRHKHNPNRGHLGVGTTRPDRAQASKAILRAEYEAMLPPEVDPYDPLQQVPANPTAKRVPPIIATKP